MQYIVHPVIAHAVNKPGSDANKSRCYAIVALQTGMVAGLQAGAAKIEQQPWTASTRQMFRFVPRSGGVEIEVVDSGEVLAIENGSTADRAGIVAESRRGDSRQLFKLDEFGAGGQFIIQSVKSNKVFDLSNYKQGAGGTIYQYEKHQGDNQRWLLTEVVFDRQYEDLSATIYEDPGYGGKSQTLGVGSYDMSQLTLPNDSISSVRVPTGLRVSLFEHVQFKGARSVLLADTSDLRGFSDTASSIVVEKVVSFYSGVNYGGDEMKVGIGGYTVWSLDDGWIGNDRLKSMRVPEGMMVVAFEHDNYKGDHIIIMGDEPTMPSGWNTKISSLIVKQTGVLVPNHAVRYGGKLQLFSQKPGKILTANDDGNISTTNVVGLYASKFEIVRSGATVLRSHVCFGDIVTLKSNEGKYVVAEAGGDANANRTAIGEWEKWRIVRAGGSGSRSFVCDGDLIALESVPHKKYLGATSGTDVKASATGLTELQRWSLRSYEPPNQSGDGGGPSARTGRSTTSPPSPCGANVCVAEACIADACGAAACGSAAQLASVCAAAATGMVACGVDVAGLSVGGLAACVVAIEGIGTCGADMCGAAVCGAAACGAAACAAAGCGADACGVAASILTACGGNAGGLNMCGADACIVNACGVNLCPVDACAADACGVDLVPVIPFI